MYFSDVNGYMTLTVKSSTDVFADMQSLKRSEFYAAMAAGQKYDLVFVVHAEDWGNQNQVGFNGVTYSVERTYSKKSGDVELVCQKRSGL